MVSHCDKCFLNWFPLISIFLLNQIITKELSRLLAGKANKHMVISQIKQFFANMSKISF